MEANAKPQVNYASLFANSDEAIVLFATDGSTVNENPAARALFRRSPDEPAGRTFLKQFSSQDTPEARAAFERALSGESERLETSIVGDEETAIPVEVGIFPAADAVGTIVGIFQVARDLRAARFAEQLMFKDHERFRSLFEHNLDPVMFLDIGGMVDRVNSMFEDLTRTRGEDIIRKSWTEILSPEAHDEAQEIFSRALGGEPQQFETTLLPASSSTSIPVRIKHVPLWVDGEVIGTSVVIKNIATERITSEHMQRLAFHDALTGLPNRALFGDRLIQHIANAKRYNHPFSMMFLDLDGFKLINDRYGHATGDNILRAFGERLLSIMRESDTFARLGGDEFAILQPLIAVPEDAEALAQKLIDALAEPFAIDDESLSVGLSVGVAVFPWHGADDTTLFRAADRALYEAKSSGKNTFRLAAPL